MNTWYSQVRRRPPLPGLGDDTTISILYQVQVGKLSNLDLDLDTNFHESFEETMVREISANAWVGRKASREGQRKPKIYVQYGVS